MARTIDQWLDEHVAKYEEYSIAQLGHEKFFRDPARPQFIDSNLFFSPADGIIIYQQMVEEDGKFLEVKGEQYTLSDLLQTSDVKDILPCLVVGVFMSFFDCHVNRIPYGGRLQYEFLEPISSRNLPMLLVEKGIKEGRVDTDELTYLKYNERVLNTIYSPKLDYTYHVLQIADKDVSAIVPFDVDQNGYFTQNERFGMIRWGSQVDLILPLDGRFKFHLVNKVTDHVEAGVDPLVRLEFLDDHKVMLPK
jgi:phosphatidylserine decarboxylase